MTGLLVSVQIEGILPLTMPALANLKRLTLRDMRLNYLEDTVCQALKSLTFLDISYNEFESFPWVVRDIATLVQLDISGNCDLKLTDEDIDTLQEMHQAGLQILDIDDIPRLLDHDYALSPESSVAFRRLWWDEICFSPVSMDSGCWTEDF